MSIWGRRDGEPPAGETPEAESGARADETQAPAEQEQQGEPAPAFWRTQGEAAAPAGREPAQAPPPAHGYVPAAPASADGDDAAVAEGKMVPDGMRGERAGAHEADTGEPAVPASPAAPGGTSPERWSEILATFVDDPRGSVKMAADTVDAAIDEFVTTVRARQRALASSWDGSEADTERLRVALRDYRTFWYQVRQLDLSGRTG